MKNYCSVIWIANEKVLEEVQVTVDLTEEMEI